MKFARHMQNKNNSAIRALFHASILLKFIDRFYFILFYLFLKRREQEYGSSLLFYYFGRGVFKELFTMGVVPVVVRV